LFVRRKKFEIGWLAAGVEHLCHTVPRSWVERADRRSGESAMRLKTRLTEKLAIAHPILLAPMHVMAGGKLAAAVSDAGGLGLIGGGYGNSDWLELQYAAAGNARVGCGFITWSTARSPELLDQVLAKHPAALMLSFGEVEPHASRIKAQGVPLICQFQGMKYLRNAVDAGADIVVAEGCEAGGHSGYRGLFTLVARGRRLSR